MKSRKTRKDERHGLRNTVEYNSWHGMKQRCVNPNNVWYKNYGGRGIKVCDKWLNSFMAFYKDMGKKPSKHHTLERIDNNADYSPSNTRWANRQEQNLNRRQRPSKNVFKGIYCRQENRYRKYAAIVSFKHRNIFLGYYATPEEAANVYDQVSVQIYGDGAVTNFDYN